MNDLYSFMRNNTLSRDKLNYEVGSTKNIHYGDIHTKFAALFDIAKEHVPYVNSTEETPDAESEDYCVEGDLIFADASEDTNDVGKCMEIVRLRGQQLLSGQHTILARRKDDTLVVGFGGHLFRSGLIRSRIEKEAQGTKVYQISPSRLGGLKITFPGNKAEQQKIADCLTSLDEVIAAQARKVEALKAHKRGLMQQLFPREGETRPRLRFPEFRDAPEWNDRSLGSMTTKVGSGITPRGGDKNYKTEGRSFMRSQNVGWGQLLLDEIVFIDESTHASFDGTEIAESDVLLNITGASIGRSAIADNRIAGGNVNQHVCIIRTRQDELNPVLLNQFLISERGQEQIDSFQAGGNRQGLNFSQIRSFQIPLPPTRGEQQRIADCLSSLDTQITAESNQLAALKAHKQGLMQQLFPAPEATGA
ncbi:MAG: restriction endonuclease subunit S [Xanthomonadaceae bacterium]|nr:restriction endonuclease subunit S [Xanthomonadaceae bacterium]